MSSRINPCSYLPRRLQVVASLTVFVVLCILFLGTSNSDDYDQYLQDVPFGPQLQSGTRQVVQGAHQVVDRLPTLPKGLTNVGQLNPFRAPAHAPPPVQANSSSGEARWYSDWKWRNPFSSSVTLDEERALLPPLKQRPPIYTYFDTSGKTRGGKSKDEKTKNAEQDLLLIWRRAWWAQGFKPVVLGRSEAMNNPLFRSVQGMELKSELDEEILRWLAWGNMGTGVLCNWLALPMAPYDDPLLSYLRRGEYPSLTRYEGLENGLFSGSRDNIEKAVRSAIDALSSSDAERSEKAKNFKTIFETVPGGTFDVDSQHDGIAYYSLNIINSKYTTIKDKLADESTKGDGMALLPPLINSHLHMAWQNTFSSGIAILKPVPQHTTSVVEAALEIARNLSQCPENPIPSSCPPNRPHCKPCVSSHPMLLSTPPVFRNTSTLFTIGTVPHPYTMASLTHTRDEMPLKFIRRETARDSWISATTKELLGTGLPAYARLVSMKDAIATEYGFARSLWLTAEHPPSMSSEKDLEELDWLFGFEIPRHPIQSGKSETPVPGPERRPPPPKPEFGDGPVPSDQDLQREKALLEKARMTLRYSEKGGKESAKVTRDIIEAWNLADTEVWKFVRAFNARRRIERRRWEDDEEAFLGRGFFDRWMDKIT